MEGKKISFGFMKTKKTDKPLVQDDDVKKEYIQCLEEKSIKIIGGETVNEKEPLIIPTKSNTLVTAERLQQIAEEVESSLDPEPTDKPPEHENAAQIAPENETLDEMAKRELLEEAKKEVKTENATFAVSLSQAKVLGEKESTLDDYETVPIAEFGMAMLRGMGWTPGTEEKKYKEPKVRPKGLGLGADKVLKSKKAKNNGPTNGEDKELMVISNGFVKVVSGKYIGYYGKVISMDQDTSRVTLNLPMKKETITINEMFVQAVTKTEFDQQSRVLNADKYEDYKKSEQISQSQSKTKHSSSKYKEISKSRSEEDKESDNDNSRRNERYKYSEYKGDSKRELEDINNDRNRRDDRDRNSDYKRNIDDREYKKDNSEKNREYRKDRDSYYRKEGDRREYSKCAGKDNGDRYNGNGSGLSKKNRSSSNESIDSLPDEKREIRRRKDRESRRRHSSSSEERSQRRERKYSNSDLVDSDSAQEVKRSNSVSDSDSSDTHTHKRSKKNKKHKRASTPVAKRDIDKKRKGKKKKRDRDRSPHYKKHRK